MLLNQLRKAIRDKDCRGLDIISRIGIERLAARALHRHITGERRQGRPAKK